MANLVKPLDESKAYVYCPRCRDAGTESAMLTREMHVFKCQFGHQYSSWS